MLYICSVDVGLHLEKQSISILSIFILEAGSSDASRSHFVDHLSLFRQFSEKFAGNVSLLYLCSDGKSPVVKFYISKSVSCFSLPKEIAKFLHKSRRIRQSRERSCLSHIHSPRQGGIRYPIRRGSGLFIS